ncbi:SPOR domain-containing protein [Sinanaerobacter sp. ZZT-01]|uniref:SPOR domain-containing protein n=1 Tax=Sinanaerobacter sp. ZZT-01 TaxID=3111540 RepID=UPI002D79A081|nr:SPOR domain-containing protein [Sinanaerobacter sp. ZZT-01]WRR92912.1 SPOR domain-containing protein [Sinanaerobacter sp. ZZT-01]
MRRRGRYGKSINGLLFLLVIIFLSVFSGYMGTKYVIAPILYSEQEEQQATDQEKDKEKLDTQGADSPENGADKGDGVNADSNENKKREDVVSGKQEVKDLPKDSKSSEEPEKSVSAQGNTSGLFCLQFGSFSNKNAAETCVQELTQKNISTFVMEKDGSFKVLSIPYETKEKAKAAAEQLQSIVEDTYVVSM